LCLVVVDEHAALLAWFELQTCRLWKYKSPEVTVVLPRMRLATTVVNLVLSPALVSWWLSA